MASASWARFAPSFAARSEPRPRRAAPRRHRSWRRLCRVLDRLGTAVAMQTICILMAVRVAAGIGGDGRALTRVARQMFAVSAIVFGRDVYSIMYGATGVLIALEGYQASQRRSHRVMRLVRPAAAAGPGGLHRRLTPTPIARVLVFVGPDWLRGI